MDGPPNVVRAFAAEKHIPIEGIEWATERTAIVAGDAVVAFVTFREAERVRYWLIRLTIASPTPDELRHYQAHTDTVTITKPDRTKKRYEFAGGTPLALDIDTVGPFSSSASAKVGEKHARTLIDPDLLSVGLDQACLAFEASQPPTDPTAVAPSAKRVPPPVLTDAEYRSVAGAIPALMAFVQAVEKTPGLRELLWDIAQKPSVWSVVKSAGKLDIALSLGENGITAERIAETNEHHSFGSAMHRLPITLQINRQDSIVASLFVAKPSPPLQTTAGIVGIVAQPPGTTDKRLDIRLVSARVAPK